MVLVHGKNRFAELEKSKEIIHEKVS